jgi:hypothetical protein
MVQQEPNLELVLKHLAPCGAVLAAESTVSAMTQTEGQLPLVLLSFR